MAVDEWLARFGTTGEPRTATAGRIVRYLTDHAAGVGTVLDVRNDADRDLIVIDLRTGAPQRPVHDVIPVERIGILVHKDALPIVLALRDDFPDTVHQQLVAEGWPSIICIDDRPWVEARLTWTPSELLDRILTWFGRAARGELHDPRQPLDPVLFGTGLGFVVPRDVLAAGTEQDLGARFLNPSLLSVAPVAAGKGAPFTVVAVRLPADTMRGRVPRRGVGTERGARSEAPG